MATNPARFDLREYYRRLNLDQRPHDDGEPWCPRCESDANVSRVGDRFMCYCCGYYTYNPADIYPLDADDKCICRAQDEEVPA